MIHTSKSRVWWRRLRRKPVIIVQSVKVYNRWGTPQSQDLCFILLYLLPAPSPLPGREQEHEFLLMLCPGVDKRGGAKAMRVEEGPHQAGAGQKGKGRLLDPWSWCLRWVLKTEELAEVGQARGGVGDAGIGWAGNGQEHRGRGDAGRGSVRGFLDLVGRRTEAWASAHHEGESGSLEHRREASMRDGPQPINRKSQIMFLKLRLFQPDSENHGRATDRF